MKNLVCALLVGSTLMLGGCVRIFPDADRTQKTLLLNPGPIAVPQGSVNWQLLIMRPTTSAHLDTNLIAVDHQNSTAAYVEGAEWSNDMPDVLQDLLLDAFFSSGKIMGVSTSAAAIHPNYGLQLDVDDFGLKVLKDQAHPIIMIRFTASMIDFKTRRVVRITNLAVEQSARSNKSVDVMEGFNVALRRILTDLVEWTLVAPEARAKPS